MYNKDTFSAMIWDWQADNAPEYDDLKIGEPHQNNGKWVAVATDNKCSYELSDDGSGNIIINYLGTL